MNQSIDRFLQHTTFVAQNDLWSSHIDQLFQAVVTIDDPTVKVVQIGGGKFPPLELNHRTQGRREDWDHIEDHILRIVSRASQLINHFQSFDQPPAVSYRSLMFQLHCQILVEHVEVESPK